MHDQPIEAACDAQQQSCHYSKFATTLLCNLTTMFFCATFPMSILLSCFYKL